MPAPFEPQTVRDVNLPLTAFGDLRSANLKPQFQASFEYTVDNEELNTNTVVDGGTVTQASGMAVVTSSTTTASTAQLKSKRHARYRSGLGGLSRFTALFTAGVAATEQLVGLGDERGSSEAFKNGYMVGFIGTGFGIHRFSDDAVTSVAQADFDDPLDGTGLSGITLDPTKLNVYQIQYQYLGGGPIYFFVEEPVTGSLKLFHTISYANANVVPSTLNPNFHHQMFVNNKATTSNLIVKSSSYGYFIEGETSFVELHQPEFATGEQTTGSIQTELAIFTIRNKALYASKTNFIDIFLMCVSASIEADAANNLGRVRVVKNATLGGTPSYADIEASDSVVDMDTAGTTVTGGKELFSLPLAGKNDSVVLPVNQFKIILAPGETLTVSGLSVASATINASAIWRELF